MSDLSSEDASAEDPDGDPEQDPTLTEALAVETVEALEGSLTVDLDDVDQSDQEEE
jgi:hypothetical protein